MLVNNQAILALTVSSEEGQVQIASRGCTALRAALACSHQLRPAVANKLASSSAMGTSQRALLRADDPELLLWAVDTGPFRAAWAARNTLTPESALVSAARSPNHAVSFAALMNESTPLELRRELLTPSWVQQIVETGSSLSARVVRAAELAISNPWMAENPVQWSRVVRRGIACLPQLSKRQLVLCGGSKNGALPNWPGVSNHPAFSDCASAKTLDQMIELASPAVDLSLVEHEDLTLDHARRIVVGRNGVFTEPHIIGRLIRRFGIGVLTLIADENEQTMAGTRLAAASFVEPSAAFGGVFDQSSFDAAQSAAEILGHDSDSWEMMISLLKTDVHQLDSLARSARKLTALSRI